MRKSSTSMLRGVGGGRRCDLKVRNAFLCKRIVGWLVLAHGSRAVPLRVDGNFTDAWVELVLKLVVLKFKEGTILGLLCMCWAPKSPGMLSPRG